MTDYRVIVTGSPSFHDRAQAFSFLDVTLQSPATSHNIVILSNGSPGASKIGEWYAQSRGYDVHRFRPRYRVSKDIQYKQMTLMCHSMVAFWDGESPETVTLSALMRRLHKPATIFRF